VILIDTDIVSLAMRGDPTVLDWLNTVDELVTSSSITRAEIAFGIERHPDPTRREVLEAMASRIFAHLPDQLLPMDDRAARAYGRLAADLARGGRVIGREDTQIASIALSRGAAIATRNVRHFAQTGVKVINPFGDL
jgi:predicted nucleic acid-binding protein